MKIHMKIANRISLILFKFSIFFFLFVPIFIYSQTNISVNLVERTDANKDINGNINFSIEKFINNKISIGITNSIAKSDYIKEGVTPVQDTLIVSSSQIFSKYYFSDNIYFLIQSPISSKYPNISVNERIRVGGGYCFNIRNNLLLNVNYNLLLNRNTNGFRKGKIIVGFIIKIDH